jgi:hypothetical protein
MPALPPSLPRAAAALALMLAGPAQALDLSVDLFSVLDARLVSENRDSGEEIRAPDTDGLGARVIAWPGRGPLFFSAEFSRLDTDPQTVTVDETTETRESRLEQARIGVGLINRTAFYSRLEVIRTEGEDRVNGDSVRAFSSGLGVHAGAAGEVYRYLLMSGELGYVDLDLLNDEDEQRFGRGLQATLRAEVPIIPLLQVFGEYRYQRLRLTRDPPKVVDEIGEFRLGLRLNF